MCGRFTLKSSGKAVAKAFALAETPDMFARYNIAPTQPVLAVREAHGRSGREAVSLRWGLIPPWAEDIKVGSRMINARSESAADKPAFRAAFRERRCLVVADGFYEWQKPARQPYLIHLKDQQPFAFAGLWERWRSPENQQIESCTILTTAANDLVNLLHVRMPVILHPGDYDRWLDPKMHDVHELQAMLQPLASEEMSIYPVSTRVNNVRHEDAGCIAPAARDLFGAPEATPAPKSGKKRSRR